MEPALPPAGNADDEDEATLVREPLRAGVTRRTVAPRPLLRGLSLALTATLIVVAVGVILQRLRQPDVAGGSTLSLSTPTGPPTPAPTIPPGQGWTPSGPPWAQWIVFAPSAPGTAYLCGTPTNTDPNRQAPVWLGLSQDSGDSWQSWATAIRAGGCVVDVDPTNARDLLLEVEQCDNCTIPGPAQLYRSLDGGKSWHLVELPPAPGSSSAATDVTFQWAWQGSTLFVSPSLAGTQPPSLIAVSVTEGPFVWVNQKALLAGVPAGSHLNDIYANTQGIYADFYVPSSGATGFLTKVSADLGATWPVFQPRYQGKKVNLVDLGVSVGDGSTLVGEVVSGQNANTGLYVTSTDGGAMWTPTAAAPGDLLIMGLASTPSGTFYAEMTSPDGYPTALQGSID